MTTTTLTRRTLLNTAALATTTLAAPLSGLTAKRLT